MEDESKNKKMKTILVPIDFSPSSDNAMNYAAYLAAKVGASLLLVHVYQIPVSMNDMPVLMVSAEELKNSADKGLQKAQEELQ
jgi:nucleotide-binding universal stress UspA family protein